jgi:DNA-binding transcriptional LysR family regulator
MEVQQLRHLLAAVRYGNLLKAAEEIHISQSGLSRSIKSLETRLGVPLLIRKSKGVEPTVFGLSLINRAKVIINEVARSIEEIKAIEAARVGEVTIGITQNYSHYLIPDVIADLAKSRPEVRITVISGAFGELVEKLKIGDLDFAFGLLGAIEENSDLTVEELFESHSRVIARSDHPLAGKPSVSVRDLAKAKWAMLNGDGFQRNFLNFFYVRGQNIPSQAIKTNSISFLKRALQTVDVLTVLPADTVHDEIKSGELTVLNCETPADYARVGMIFRAESLVTPQMKQLIDRIRRAVEDDRIAHAAPAPALLDA